MKKILPIILALLSVFCIWACSSHKEGELAYNATHHWYTCSNKSCDERISEQPHSRNGGEVVKEPTETMDGSKVYICTVCGATKTEAVPQTLPGAVTADAWDRAFSQDSFLNVTAFLTETITNDGEEHKTEYKIMANQYLVYLTTVQYINGVECSYSARLQDNHFQWVFTSREEKLEDVTPITVPSADVMTGQNILKNYSLDFFTKFDSFTYDSEERCYKAERIETEQGEFTQVSVKLSEGKIISISANVSPISQITVTFKDYGKTEPKRQ